ncbi:MAG TPA: sulfotransferase domain-containing protein [Candidatus Aquilonibacter sp.]|nr:sulfotransferase domain-containing protein [Candidatus Aquilonibacter sp.]
MWIVRRGLRHLSRVNDVLWRKTLLEREITIFPDDAFLTSYPRSGNTWSRFLVGNLIRPSEDVTFLNIEKIVPDMYKTADMVLRRLPRPRVLKSHELFDPRYGKVIYIVRDPRDVAVSNYHWEMKLRSIREGYPIEQFVPRWMEAQFWRRIGSWADHVNSWLATREGKDCFLLIRYEDLKKDPRAELRRMAGLLGVEASPQILDRAVGASSAERMSEMESTQAGKWVATHRTRPDKPFVRQGASGGWRSVLPPPTVVLIESQWGGLMKKLGYELAAEEAVAAAELQTQN